MQQPPGASGGATYSIPIAVPPGTNGIAPNLSVAYNSMGGNGLLGMGWSLSGMSAITRVSRTVYHDGAAEPVELSANDRFAMDGTRLIGTAGTYGDNNATYATESESFATVTSYATAGVVGTGWFKVVAKDGTTIEFGNTTDSRKINAANQCVYWRLNKILYPDGNYILFKYTNVDSDLRIDQILYTGNDNAGLLPYNTVQFSYKVRSDVNTVYEAGVAIVNKYLLDNITVSAESTSVKTYQFTYGWDSINSYLTEIVEKAGDGSALNSTLFKYGDAPALSTTIASGNSIQTFSGDFDGDGKHDILTATQSQTTNGIPYFSGFKVYKQNGSGYTQLANKLLPTNFTIVRGYEIPNANSLLATDFTGDGLDDVMTLNISPNGTESKLENITIYESINGGTDFTPHTRVVQPNYYRIHSSNKFFYPGDFNGDGISEYITILGNTLSSYEPFLCTDYITGGACGSILINGPSSFPITDWVTVDKINVVDFNGDGKSDLMLIKDNLCEIFTLTGSTATRIYSSNFPTSDHTIFLGDFNGDRKTDILARTTDGFAIKGVSDGITFIQSDLILADYVELPSSVNTSSITIGDYNGDGRSDIYLQWDMFGTTASRPAPSPNDDPIFSESYGEDIYYSQGDTFLHYEIDRQDAQGTSTSLWQGIIRPKEPVDLNGDGRTDLVVQKTVTDVNNISTLYFKKDGQENLLQKVSNGVNHVSEWVYQNLTAGGTFYNRSSSSSYPLNTLQPSLYTVSTLNSQNGIGGTVTVQYSYVGAKFHRAGKGFLGFTEMVSNNITTGITTVSINELNSTFFTLAPSIVNTSLGGTLLNHATLTNEWVDLGNKRFWYRVNSTNTDNYFEGRTASTANTYDSYGNITISTATNNGIETTTTTTQFGQYGTPVPARPTTTTTSKTRTGQPAYPVTTAFEYNALGQITQKTDFSGLAQNVVTTYGYNNLGNVINTSVTPAGMASRTSSASYDSKGRFALSSTNVLGQNNSATYDARWGKPLTSTGIDGLTTSYQYDAWGRTTQTSLPEGYAITQSWGWDQTNGAVYYNLIQHPGKPDVKSWKDVLGRELKKETEGFNGQTITQRQTYDARSGQRSHQHSAVPLG